MQHTQIRIKAHIQKQARNERSINEQDYQLTEHTRIGIESHRQAQARNECDQEATKNISLQNRHKLQLTRIKKTQPRDERTRNEQEYQFTNQTQIRIELHKQTYAGNERARNKQGYQLTKHTQIRIDPH